MDGYEQEQLVILLAVRYVWERAGNYVVIAAFGDPDAVDAAWGHPVPEFREFLRRRTRSVLMRKVAT